MIYHNCTQWACGKQRPHAQWDGADTIHCAQCGELFVSTYAFDRHLSDNEQCFDPGIFRKKDGSPEFIKEFHSSWEPNYAWTYIMVIDPSEMKFR